MVGAQVEVMAEGEILLTGADGVIGTVLRRGLARPMRPFAGDLRRAELVDAQVVGAEAIIHLAWNTRDDHMHATRADPDNYAMAENVLAAAASQGVRRVVVASSIHADMPAREPGGLRSPYRPPEPSGPYGANKVAVEALGHRYARRRGLEVICVRFGVVSSNPAERPRPDRPSPAGVGWLSHRDCVSLVAACLDAPAVPGGYAIVYGVSERLGGVHHLANQLGWRPRDLYPAAAGCGAGWRADLRLRLLGQDAVRLAWGVGARVQRLVDRARPLDH